MKTLSHRYIVHLHEVMWSPRKLYIVLELVMGKELFEILNERGPFPEATARRLFQQLADGVNYCHAMEIVHRDLKVRAPLPTGTRLFGQGGCAARAFNRLAPGGVGWWGCVAL